MEMFDKIKEMVEIMKDFDLTEIEVKDGEKEIKLKKGGDVTLGGMALNPMAMPQPAAVAAGGAAEAEKDPNLLEVKSPMVGSFFRAPSPESPPYVTEGDKVNRETVLCIVEAMKVMNEIKAELSGEVAEVLVENGEAVEFGQPLFLVRRSS